MITEKRLSNIETGSIKLKRITELELITEIRHQRLQIKQLKKLVERLKDAQFMSK